LKLEVCQDFCVVVWLKKDDVVSKLGPWTRERIEKKEHDRQMEVLELACKNHSFIALTHFAKDKLLLGVPIFDDVRAKARAILSTRDCFSLSYTFSVKTYALNAPVLEVNVHPSASAALTCSFYVTT
jgi:hypothetical protein